MFYRQELEEIGERSLASYDVHSKGRAYLDKELNYRTSFQRDRELKDFLFSKLYRHYRVGRMQVKAEHILTGLFNTCIAEPLILPDHVQQRIPARGLERTICDYIAGMTDRYAINEHARLHDPSLKP